MSISSTDRRRVLSTDLAPVIHRVQDVVRRALAQVDKGMARTISAIEFVDAYLRGQRPPIAIPENEDETIDDYLSWRDHPHFYELIQALRAYGLDGDATLLEQKLQRMRDPSTVREFGWEQAELDVLREILELTSRWIETQHVLNTKQYRDPGGKITVTLCGPEIEASAERSAVLREYDWHTIVGALRVVVTYLRENLWLRDLKPANNRADYLQASAARQAIGNPMSIAWHCFTIDPRRSDCVGVEESEVADTLWLCLQDRGLLQGAAIRLWCIYQDVRRPLADSAVPWLDDSLLSQFEQAIDAVAKMTVDTVSLTSIAERLRIIAEIQEVDAGRPSESAKENVQESLTAIQSAMKSHKNDSAEVRHALEAAFIKCLRLDQFYRDPGNDRGIIDYAIMTDEDKQVWLQHAKQSCPEALARGPLPTAEEFRKLANLIAPPGPTAETIDYKDRLIEHPECYVTLSQMAGIVNRKKRTLERLAAKPSFPAPDVEGGGGKPNEWRWATVRPILEAVYQRTLPDIFPADQFVR